MTYRELTYIVLDLLKMVSDDSHFSEEHILFLSKNYRALLLSRKYEDKAKEIPQSNYQTICLDVEHSDAIEGLPCSGQYMKSSVKIPTMLGIGNVKLSGLDFFSGNFTLVNNERFKYVGYNKYLQNQIYATIAPDNYLYLKSNNPQAYYIGKVKVTGIFEDSNKANELQCEDSNGGEDNACDIMDKSFPIEEDLIPQLIQAIVQELGGQKYQSKDAQNNAKDDLSELAAYIKNQLANGRRSDLYKQYQ